LARLLAMTSVRVCCAIMPVAAVRRAGFMSEYVRVGYCGAMS
jgi:hypothetical protein